MNAMPRRITRWAGSAGACVLSTTPPRIGPRLDLDDPAGRDADVDAAPHREDLDRDRVGRRHRVAQVDVAAAHDGGHLDVRDRAAGPPIRAPEDREDPDDLAADSGRGRAGARRPRRGARRRRRAGRPGKARRERRVAHRRERRRHAGRRRRLGRIRHPRPARRLVAAAPGEDHLEPDGDQDQRQEVGQVEAEDVEVAQQEGRADEQPRQPDPPLADLAPLDDVGAYRPASGSAARTASPRRIPRTPGCRG